MNCNACNKTIDQMELLQCTACNVPYHYKCLNITTAQFMTRNHEVTRTWRCLECINITRRRNDDTPVRQQLSAINDTIMSVDDLLDDEADIEGDTQRRSQIPIHTSTNNQTITLENISKLLDSKLAANNESLIINMSKLIKSQISIVVNQLKKEISQNLTEITREQDNLKIKIEDINKHIQIMEIENNNLKSDLKKLKENETYQRNGDLDSTKISQHNNITCNKKIVLFGLDEYHHESQEDLYDRITNIFYNILGVNVNVYIEDLKRIGRRGYSRPLAIEFMSQRVTKYILQNSSCFNGTGIAISTFLDNQALDKKRKLKKAMLKAREAGKHAVIRNEKLIIDGLEYDAQSKTILDSNTPKNEAKIPETQNAQYLEKQPSSSNSQNKTFFRS